MLMDAEVTSKLLFQVIKGADIIFLAVKPQFVAPVLKEVRQHLTENHTIVSIAAGKTLASLKVSKIPLILLYLLRILFCFTWALRCHQTPAKAVRFGQPACLLVAL